MKRVIVIGGGASGLLAAIMAARQGANVVLIEKNRQAGKKLLVTGNGRCNFTNRDQNLSHYRSNHPELVEAVLKEFSMEKTVAFFEELGIFVKDRSGYLYPGSGQASSMADVLRLEVQRLAGTIKEAYNTEVLAVEKQGDLFKVQTKGWTYEGEAVILACGSEAAPKTGSTGDGYRFAKSLGHHVIPPLPALTGVYVYENDRGSLAGVRTDAKVTLLIDGGICIEEEGEVQFASYGLSGIPVFQVSRYVSRALENGQECIIHLDLCSRYSVRELEEILANKGTYTGKRKGTDILLGMFPEKLSTVLLNRAGISAKKYRKEWTDADCFRLAEQMKGLSFHIFGCRGYEQAQVCTGGVPLTEIKGISMESAMVSGLYFAGELLDVDGACGGYNLQWAWSSGFLAGVHAAENNERESSASKRKETLS